MLQAAGQAVAAALQRLHPHAALFAQAQRQAGGGQVLPGRVGVDRLQPSRARTGRGHRAAQGRAVCRGHLEFEFDFQSGLCEVWAL